MWALFPQERDSSPGPRHGGEERSDSEAEPADIETDPLKRMRSRLASEEGRALYARRQAVVEPVNGQIKHARGFRQFSFRGLEAAGAEWALVCLCHNLLKMFRNRPEEAPAGPRRSAVAPLAREERPEAFALQLGVLLFCLSRPAGAREPRRQLQPPSRLRPGKRLRRTDS